MTYQTNEIIFSQDITFTFNEEHIHEDPLIIKNTMLCMPYKISLKHEGRGRTTIMLGDTKSYLRFFPVAFSFKGDKLYDIRSNYDSIRCKFNYNHQGDLMITLMNPGYVQKKISNPCVFISAIEIAMIKNMLVKSR